MSYPLTIELNDAAYAALQQQAQAAARSPAELAATVLEQRFGRGDVQTTETDKQALRKRFERHFGAVNLGHATGVDNDVIDADLARAYADSRLYPEGVSSQSPGSR